MILSYLIFVISIFSYRANSEVVRNKWTTFLGTIEKYSQCSDVSCLVACVNNSNIEPGKKCIECPVCGPEGQPCPIYKCSGYTKQPLFDEDGCQVCSACNPKTGTCSELNCTKPDECSDCTELYTPKLWHGGPGCTECRRSSKKRGLKRCKFIKCAEPDCPYGTFATALSKDDCSECCRTRKQCQPGPTCDSVICEQLSNVKCPSGYIATEQTDAIGCRLCPTCVPCPARDCLEPKCGNCSKAVTPELSNKCHGCPECRAKSKSCKLKICNNIRCRAPGCENGFISLVSKDSQGCCKECAHCQPSSTCSDVICDPSPRCPPGSTAEQQTDSNGCKLCKICIRSNPTTTATTTTTTISAIPSTPTSTTTEPTMACGEPPTCKPCSEYYRPILPNGCLDCPACRNRTLVCRKCEKIVQPDPSCVDCCPTCQLQDGFCDDCPALSNCPAIKPICGICSRLVSPTFPSNCPGCDQCEIMRPQKLCPPVTCDTPECKSYIHYLENSCCRGCSFECQVADTCPKLICGRCRDDAVPVFQTDKQGCITSCPQCVPP